MVFGSFGKRKYKAFVFEGSAKHLVDATLKYDKATKKWFIHLGGKFKGEKIPAPENIFDYLVDNFLFLEREALDKYKFLSFEVNKNKVEVKDYPIEPEEIALATLSAERVLKSRLVWWEKMMPVFLFVLALVGIGIFLAMAMQGYGDMIKKSTENLVEFARIQQNSTFELINTLKQIIEERAGVLQPR